MAVIMIDGIDLGERTIGVALGITTEGIKIPLGLWVTARPRKRRHARCGMASMLQFLEDGTDLATKQVELLARVGLAPG